VARFRAIERVIDETQADSGVRQTRVGVAQLATGIATAGVGAYSMARGSVGSGLAMVLGGGFATTAGLLALGGTGRDEQLDARLRELEGQPTDPAAVHEAEYAWYLAAGRAGRLRARAATVSMIVGGLVCAFGLTAAAVNLHLPTETSSRDDRVAFGGALGAVGSSLLLSGLYAALTEVPLEAGWRAYGRLTSPDESAHVLPRVSVSPAAGGAVLGMSGVF
jgi:hypothetical protein